jgi:uncharacterized protein YggE
MRFRIAISCLFAWPALSALALAQLPFDGDAGLAGITVYGNAEYKGRPNLVEIDVRVAGQDELTDDATTKYRDARKQTQKAFEALGLKNLEITERALSMQPGAADNDGRRIRRGPKQKSLIEMSSVLRLRLKDVRDLQIDELMTTVGKLLDAAQDTGASFAGVPVQDEDDEQIIFMDGMQQQHNTSGLVRFVLDDLGAAREKVYGEAVADARNRAERLAKLQGVRLGQVIAVQELHASAEEVRGGEPARIVTNTPLEAVYRVRLLVRYAIETTAAKTSNSTSALPQPAALPATTVKAPDKQN